MVAKVAGKGLSEYMDSEKGVTHIGERMTVRGEIQAEDNFLLDGRLEGNVEAEGFVYIGPQGAVKGDIVAQNVLIEGTVEGNVQSRDRMELRPAGRVMGDIQAARVKIAEGSTFQGRLITAGPSGTSPGKGGPA
jgi:cytoskeletal protein CcmA (bactofilin family)